jgi:acetolactate synthase-1/2/3 large subunit
MGLPLATGAAVGAPDRPVIGLQADGSAMYTPSALWTQAREGLNVTTIVYNNAAYAILRMELARVGAADAGPKARQLLDLSGPVTDFAALATSMGVPGVTARTGEELTRELGRALSEDGPHLIEAVVPPIL